MQYDISKYSDVLELDKVLSLLSNEASLIESREELLKIKPSSNINKVKAMLKETNAAFTLIAHFSARLL